MKAAIAAFLCVAGVLAASAFADLEKGTYAPDIEAKEWVNCDEPVTLREVNGMIVVLFFWVTWNPGGEYMMDTMNQIDSRFARSLGIYLVGLTDADRERIQDTLRTKKVFFPVGAASDSYEEYDIDSFPAAVVIDPTGKVVWTGHPGAEANELGNAIRKCIEDTPPWKTHPEEAAIAKRHLRDARQALREERYKDAFEAAKLANEHALAGDALKTSCYDVLELIEVVGRDMLARADEAADEKEFPDAVQELHDVRRNFLGLAVAKTAKRKLDALEKRYPEVARILVAEEDSSKAENELAHSLEMFRERKFGEAYVRLEELIGNYPDTEAATKARTVIERTEQNENVMNYVRDHKAKAECQNLLAQARAFEKTGRPEKAKAVYRQILDEHPDTIYAKQAIQRLMELP